VAVAAAAVVLALAAALTPTAWYDALPRQPELPPLPVSGVLLLRILLFAEAIVLGAVAVVGWRMRRLPDASRYGGRSNWEEEHDLAHREDRE